MTAIHNRTVLLQHQACPPRAPPLVHVLTARFTALVLFVYDVLITFDREVASFWTTNVTGGALLFFANKWVTVTFSAMLLVEFASFPSDEVSHPFLLQETN